MKTLKIDLRKALGETAYPLRARDGSGHWYRQEGVSTVTEERVADSLAQALHDFESARARVRDCRALMALIVAAPDDEPAE